jgi:TolA-binding protein
MQKWAILLMAGTVCLTAGVVRADPPDEQLAAASALFDAKKYTEAAQKLDAFLADNPRHPKAPTAAFVLGRCRAELKQYAQAVPAYEKAIAGKDPAILPLAELGLGEAAYYSKQYDKAAPALEAATKTNLRPEQAGYAWFWLAQSDFNLKKYQQAEDAYEKVFQDYNRNEFADASYYGAGLAALRLDHPDVARQRFRDYINKNKQTPDRTQAMLMLGQIDLDAKRYGDARADFERLLNDDGSKNATDARAEAEDGLIQALLEQKDYGAAATRLESALSRLPATDPQRYRAALTLGNCRYRQQQYEPAAAAYKIAAGATEPEVAAQGMYWHATAILALNRPAEAAPLLAKFVTRFPKNPLAPKAQLKAADAYQTANQGDAALAAYRIVVTNYPTAPEAAEAKKGLAGIVSSTTDPVQLMAALKNATPAERAKGMLRVAQLYFDAKKTTEASNTLTELLKSNPDEETQAEAQYLLGLIYDGVPKTAPAIAALSEATRLRPNATWAGDAQARLALLYLDDKQPASAEKAANAALALKPTKEVEEPVRRALVQAQINQQHWDAALASDQALLDANPSPETAATARYLQAWITEKQGKADDALALWTKIADDGAKSQYTSEALLRVGNARLKAEKYDEARQRYERILSDDPKSPFAVEARFNLGSALYNLDRPSDAATAFDAVAADKTAGPYIPTGLYWAGVAYDKAGKKPEAIQRLDKLVMQFPQHDLVKKAKVRLAALKAVAGQ